MGIAERIQSAIEPSIEAKGFAVVLVRIMEGSGKRTLQIMAERKDNGQISIDDCADISRMVSALLDVEDLIQGAYQLEVSSPGLERPLVKPGDYVRYKGYEAKLETALPIEGRKRYKGKIADADEANVIIDSGGQRVTVPLANILQARLVLTDELMREYLKKPKPPANQEQ